METMSVWEFAVYCKRKRYRSISYSYIDQEWYSILNPMKSCARFGSITVSNNPNRVLLGREGNCICFEWVKAVAVDTKSVHPIGDVLHIICGKWDDDKGNITYKLLAVK